MQQLLDEPLDMSLKSRKRSPPNEYLPKKKRASVIARGGEAEVGTAYAAAIPMEVLKAEPPSPPRNSEENNSHIIVIELSNNDVEEHFRRSLFGLSADGSGVDDHFRRSLGKAKWEEIQRQNLRTKSLQSPSTPRKLQK